MKALYSTLIGDFCKLVGIAEAGDIEALAAGRPVEIDDISFTFGYDEEQAPDRLMVFCDYGPVPEKEQAKVYRALLETNLFLYESDSAVFSVMPQTGRALCATRFQLAALRGDELRSILVYLAQCAHAWRRGHFDVTMTHLNPAAGRIKSAAGAGLRSQLNLPR
jgi:hypothetical protein